MFRNSSSAIINFSLFIRILIPFAWRRKNRIAFRSANSTQHYLLENVHFYWNAQRCWKRAACAAWHFGVYFGKCSIETIKYSRTLSAFNIIDVRPWRCVRTAHSNWNSSPRWISLHGSSILNFIWLIHWILWIVHSCTGRLKNTRKEGEREWEREFKENERNGFTNDICWLILITRSVYKIFWSFASLQLIFMFYHVALYK